MNETIKLVKEKIETPMITRERFWLIQKLLKTNPKVFTWLLKNKKIWQKKH